MENTIDIGGSIALKPLYQARFLNLVGFSRKAARLLLEAGQQKLHAVLAEPPDPVKEFAISRERGIVRDLAQIKRLLMWLGNARSTANVRRDPGRVAVWTVEVSVSPGPAPYCLNCGGIDFYSGPQGGCSENVLCANPDCRTWWNFAPYMQMDELRVEPLDTFPKP